MTPIGFLERQISSPVGSYIEKFDNCRMVKSLLPVRNTTTWNPYVYCLTNDGILFSKVRKAHLPGTINEMYYDSVLHIVHKYDSSLIHLRVNQEIWAAGQGLVYSEVTDISSNTPNLDFTKPIRERIVTGTIYEMTRKDF
jgi:predicted acetyltransferase